MAHPLLQPRKLHSISKLAGVLFTLASMNFAVHAGDTQQSPFKVEIVEKKEEVSETAMPIDPAQRIRCQHRANMMIFISQEDGKTLQRVHFPMFQIDGNMSRPFSGMGRFESVNAPLGKNAAGKERNGFKSVYVQGDLAITLSTELSASKSAGAGQKRQMDSVVIRYTVENRGNESHKFGLRILLSPYLMNNAGCLFAAPNHPNKILDGVELKEGKVPDHLQILQRPDLKDPGAVAHMTLNVGKDAEKAGRLIMTRYGPGINQWEMPIMPAMGNSAVALYWEQKELKAGAKREMAYAFGKGIAEPTGGECHYQLHLGGSFEPGKLFTVTAIVEDAAQGQTLALELPEGMVRVEGKEIQAVGVPEGEHSSSMVLWKARVLRAGEFSVRVRSNAGVTQSRLIKISRAGESE